jgi:hypothetical protein
MVHSTFDQVEYDHLIKLYYVVTNILKKQLTTTKKNSHVRVIAKLACVHILLQGKYFFLLASLYINEWGSWSHSLWQNL